MSIIVNLDTAREIVRNAIRVARENKLQKLDVRFMRALESQTSTAAITELKQRLRDATADPRLDLASNPEELRLAMAEIIAEIEDPDSGDDL